MLDHIVKPDGRIVLVKDNKEIKISCTICTMNGSLATTSIGEGLIAERNGKVYLIDNGNWVQIEE